MLAGSGVAADAGRAVYQHELAQTREGESVLGILVGQFGDLLEDFSRLPFGDAALVSNRSRNLGFRE